MYVIRKIRHFVSLKKLCCTTDKNKQVRRSVYSTCFVRVAVHPLPSHHCCLSFSVSTVVANLEALGQNQALRQIVKEKILQQAYALY